MRFSRVTYNIITGILSGMGLIVSICMLYGQDWLGDLLIVAIILALGSSAGCCFAKSREPGLKNSSRLVWILITSAFTIFTISYLYLYFAFICRGIPTPYPCLMDYLNNMALVILCVAMFILSTTMIWSGLPIGKKSHYVILSFLLAVLFISLDVTILRPIFNSSVPMPQKIFSTCYSITNSLCSLASIVLLTISLNFRGRTLLCWMHISIGLILLFAGNIIFMLKFAVKMPQAWITFNDVIYLFGFIGFFRGVAFMRHTGKHRRITSSF